MELILEAFRQPFMQRALLIAVIIGAVTAWLGVYVILRGLAFVGAGIAHASFGGVAIGVFVGLPPLLTATFFCIFTGLGIAWLSETQKIREDTSVGIFFSASMALGILLLTFVRGYAGEILGYLFGNILAITPTDLWLTLGMSAGIGLLLILLSKEFRALTFDPEFLAVQGFPVRVLNMLFLILVALTVVLALKMVGVVLLSALLVIPAATAQLLTRDFRRMELWSVGIGVGVNVIGLILSYLWNVPPGATIVLLATVVFLATWVFRRK